MGLISPAGGHFAVAVEETGAEGVGADTAGGVESLGPGGHRGFACVGGAFEGADCGADDGVCPHDVAWLAAGGHCGLLATGAAVATGVVGVPTGGHCAF